MDLTDKDVAQYFAAKKAFIPIDVRSPIEYIDGHIPNAVNIPLFTNEERAEVGRIYKQQGASAAKWRAMEIVSPKIPNILSQIKEWESTGKIPFLYCWRGGSRSQAVAQFAKLAGLNVERMKGGYRAYREYILEQTPFLLPQKAIVLYGLTGTGKTEILHRLKKAGYPVLDLEAYANHKGSIFGAINGQTPHNQKIFDSLLFEDLFEMKGRKFFFMEGESKRIGHAVQPFPLYEKKLAGIHIHVTSSFETRVKRIYEEYVENTDEFQERVFEALRKIIKRVKRQEIQQQMVEAAEKKDYEQLIRLFIHHYYDPRYENKISETLHADYVIDSTSLEEATEKIIEIYEKEILGKQK